MKKLLALVLCFVMVISMTACGGTPSANVDVTPSANVDVTPSTDVDVTPSADVENTPSSSADPGKENEGVAETEQFVFEEVIVVDNEECTIKITGVDPENFWGYTLKVYLENKSAEKTYMYSVSSAAVDGVESDPFFASEVAAGKKANESISFSDSYLEEMEIEFTDIQLTFRVYDSNDWMADDVVEETVHIYPRGEENAVAFVREPQSTDVVLVDNEFATVIITGYEEDSIWGYTANLFLVNKTDTDLMFSVDEVSVNGFMADPFFATTLIAGKCEFTSMSWSNSTLEENGITEVETIEFVLRVSDYYDWMAEDFVNEVITVNP